tara:strand:- start:18 stop:458 length:441 start_codon:yes stop_codon:yes gene_type:complete
MIHKIAIVASEFNKEITDNLISGAKEEYNLKYGKNLFEANVDLFLVPGAFEIPGIIKKILQSDNKYQSIISFGCVIKGETAHFEYISNSVSKAIMDLNIKDSVKIPIMFGVLTTYNYEQALKRSKYIGNDIMKSAFNTMKTYENIN